MTSKIEDAAADNDGCDETPWDVALPQLSRSAAQRILDFSVQNGLSVGGEVLDPQVFFTVRYDRATVQWLRVALSGVPAIVSNLAGDGLEPIGPDEARARLEELIYDFDEFLERGNDNNIGLID
jgi:hypothetical protein